jgi:hypothetical protein
MAMAMAMAEVKVSMGVRMGGGQPFFPYGQSLYNRSPPLY